MADEALESWVCCAVITVEQTATLTAKERHTLKRTLCIGKLSAAKRWPTLYYRQPLKRYEFWDLAESLVGGSLIKQDARSLLAKVIEAGRPPAA